MRQFVLNLVSSSSRPLVCLDNNLIALLDTGAELPVWTDTEESLKSVFKAELVRENVSFKGFGGDAIGNLYYITLRVGDIIYPNLPIVCSVIEDAPFHMILSASMFCGLIYEVDTVNNKLNVTVPDKESHVRNLKVFDSNGKLHILVNRNSLDAQDYARAYKDFYTKDL